MVNREQMWAGIRMELTEDELDKIIHERVQADDYYNFDAIKCGMKRFMTGEVSFSYYAKWSSLFSSLDSLNSDNEALKHLYRCLADFINAESLGSSFSDYIKREMLSGLKFARLKYLDYLIRKVGKKTDGKFDNDGIAYYIGECVLNGLTRSFPVIVVDENRGVYNCFSVDSPSFLLSINYVITFDLDNVFIYTGAERFKKDIGFEGDFDKAFDKVTYEVENDESLKKDASIGWDYIK